MLNCEIGSYIVRDQTVRGRRRMITLVEGCGMWLVGLLKDGAKTNEQVYAAARAAGWTERTLRRAALEHGVQRWDGVWSLPGQEPAKPYVPVLPTPEDITQMVADAQRSEEKRVRDAIAQHLHHIKHCRQLLADGKADQAKEWQDKLKVTDDEMNTV